MCWCTIWKPNSKWFLVAISFDFFFFEIHTTKCGNHRRMFSMKISRFFLFFPTRDKICCFPPTSNAVFATIVLKSEINIFQLSVTYICYLLIAYWIQTWRLFFCVDTNNCSKVSFERAAVVLKIKSLQSAPECCMSRLN